MEMTVPGPVALVESPALVVTPHPVSLHGQRVLSAAAAEFEPGDTLAQLLDRQGVRAGEQWVVTIEGCTVPDAMWAYTRPKHGNLIECRRVPQKDALRIVAIAALSYFTFGAGGLAVGGAGGSAGLFAAGGAIGGGVWAAGAAFLAGSLVINKMLAPKMPGRGNNDGGSPTYGLSAGGRNRARPFEPMALVLGEPYAVPDIAAQPYTYFLHGEQYLWQIFHLGINCADVSNLRIGQTPIELYKGVQLLRNGLASGNSELPALGSNVDSVAGALLQAPGWPGDWTIRTSSADTRILSLDFLAQLFAVHPKSGAISSRYLHLEIFYRELGASTWLPFTDAVVEVPPVTAQVPVGMGDNEDATTMTVVLVPGVPGVAAGTLRLSNSSQTPLRASIEKYVVPGQYEVRVRKYDPDESGTGGANTVEWTQLRSFQRDAGNYDGQSRLAVQIQASGQLNGALDELNASLRAKPMPYWNGSAWVTATDRASGLCNPGALILMLARGIFDGSGRRLAGMGKSDDEIDIEGLKRFMVRCHAMGFEFDHHVQDTMSLQDLLDAIAYAGLGEICYPDGKLGVVFFAEDDPVEGVINMANVRARSFAVDYETMPRAEELEIQYFDRDRGNAWTSLRVTAPGVSNPRATARMQLIGVTKEAQAAVLGRFVMAQNLFQLKTVSLEQDLEYMTYRRGAVVTLSHDLTQWGYSGRLQAAQDVAGEIHLTLDERAPGAIPAGGSGRFIGLRLPGESGPRIFQVKAFTDKSRAVVLDEPWPVGVPLPGSTADNPAHDTLWIYDFKAAPGQRMLVSSIEPSAGGARLSLVPISQEFWDYVLAGAYSPPPSSSLLLARPVIDAVRVDESLARQGNTYFTELSLSMKVSGAFSQAELWGATGDGDFAPPLQRIAQGQSQTLRWRGGLDERWHLELRVYSETQQATPYRVIHDVLGLRAPPPNVAAVSVSGDQIAFTPVDVPDLAGYLVRFQYGVNTWWQTATPMHDGLITESPYQALRRPQGLVTILVKAVDTTGNESVDAVTVSYVFPDVLADNVLLDFPQSPTFSGTILGGTVVGGELLADDIDSFYEPLDGPLYAASDELFYPASQYGAMSYEFALTANAPGTLLLQYEIEGDGYLIEYQTGGGDPFYATPDTLPMWEPADELLYGTPSAWAVWPGSIEVDGAIEARFRITVVAGVMQGAIRSLTALLDVPDVTETLENVAISAGGTRLPITRAYAAIKTVRMTVHGGGSGLSALLIDKDPVLGPLVEIRNASGVAVSGVLDAEPQGY